MTSVPTYGHQKHVFKSKIIQEMYGNSCTN
jgi:hypothetical protein